MKTDLRANPRKGDYFTKELFGVLLIIFSFLLLCCLVFGDIIFFDVGKAIKRFLLGLFGILSYPILVWLIVLGFKITTDKKLVTKKELLYLLSFWAFVIFGTCILTAITANHHPTDMALVEFAKYSYNSAIPGDDVSTIPGGFLISALIYYPQRYLSYVGSIVVFGLLLVLTLFVFFKRLLVRINARPYPGSGRYDDDFDDNNPRQTKPIIIEEDDSTKTNPGYGSGYSSESMPRKESPKKSSGYTEEDNLDLYQKGVEQGIASVLKGLGYGQKTESQTYVPPKTDIDLERVKGNPTNVTEFNDEDFSSIEDEEDYSKYANRYPIPTKDYEEEEEEEYEEEENNEEYDYQEDNYEEEEEQEEPPIRIQPTPIVEKKKEVRSIPKESKGNYQIDEMPLRIKYNAPPLSIFKNHNNVSTKDEEEYKEFVNRVSGRILTVSSRNQITTRIVAVHHGPAVTRFDLLIPEDKTDRDFLKIENEYNLRIAAKTPIKLVAPIPGTEYAGIYVPNPKPSFVSMSELIDGNAEYATNDVSKLMFIFGKDVIGKPVTLDITPLPHIVITGASGSGKSVCVNTIIGSFILKYSPEFLRFVICDPKRSDYIKYEGLPHLMLNRIFSETEEISAVLDWVIGEMVRRQEFCKANGVAKIDTYNQKAINTGKKIIPKLVLIIDEFAALMSQDKKGIGDKVRRIARLGRSASIHMILVAQRASADALDSEIRANILGKFIFKAANSSDSRVSLGQTGAETLIGKGDCLYTTNEIVDPERAMGAYMADDEIDQFVEYVKRHNDCYFDDAALDSILNKVNGKGGGEFSSNGNFTPSEGANSNPGGFKDEYTVKALMYSISNNGLTSLSYLQRRMGIGFSRSGKILDELMRKGYVSKDKEGKFNRVLISREEFIEKFGDIFDE